jgi:hypothetical protein
MDREDVIRMAREAGFRDTTTPVVALGVSWEQVQRFAALVAAAEREACAELVVRGTDEPVQTKTLEILRKERERIATAIRARGEK